LGLEDGRVANPVMTASSYYNFWGGPWNGRLNQKREGRKGGSWYAKRQDRHPWLQVDFGAMTTIKRVLTQGRQNAAQWVKTYYVTYSGNGHTFTPYKEAGRRKVFRGNWDQFIVKTNTFRRPIRARYIRVHPVTWYSWASMRVEFYG
ncbi:predicted protein, partial [Nematostella vectensis]